MKKSKHYRKDVILARVIAALLLIIIIAVISFAVSLFTKSSDGDKDTQNTQNTQDVNTGNKDTEDLEDAEDTEPEAGVDSETNTIDKVYVMTTTQVKLRAEANTDCTTLDRIAGGTKLEVLEELDGWYKVVYNGQEGYVSATYAEVVE